MRKRPYQLIDVPIDIADQELCAFHNCRCKRHTINLDQKYHVCYGHISMSLNAINCDKCLRLFRSDFEFRQHQCEQMKCPHCDLWWPESKIQSHKCRLLECKTCNLWFSDLSHHNCTQVSTKCIVCFCKFDEYNPLPDQHYQKHHPQFNAIRQNTKLPLSLQSIISSYLEPEKTSIYCSICLKKLQKNTMKKECTVPYPHKHDPFQAAMSDITTLKRNRAQIMKQIFNKEYTKYFMENGQYMPIKL